jgi:hypothetical protein
MKLKVQVSPEGAAYVAVIDPSTNEHRKSAEVGSSQELEISLPNVHDAAEVEFGEVVDTAAEQPGGGNEGSAQGGETAEPPAGEGEQPPAGSGDGEQGGGEQPPAGEGEGEQPAPTTSEASEKPLYVISGDEVPADFVASGLETPSGETLFHFAGDAAGEPSTGNGDAISIYADADDNEQPVQAAAPAEGEAPTS